MYRSGNKPIDSTNSGVRSEGRSRKEKEGHHKTWMRRRNGVREAVA